MSSHIRPLCLMSFYRIIISLLQLQSSQNLHCHPFFKNTGSFLTYDSLISIGWGILKTYWYHRLRRLRYL